MSLLALGRTDLEDVVEPVQTPRESVEVRRPSLLTNSLYGTGKRPSTHRLSTVQNHSATACHLTRGSHASEFTVLRYRPRCANEAACQDHEISLVRLEQIAYSLGTTQLWIVRELQDWLGTELHVPSQPSQTRRTMGTEFRGLPTVMRCKSITSCRDDRRSATPRNHQCMDFV